MAIKSKLSTKKLLNFKKVMTEPKLTDRPDMDLDYRLSRFDEWYDAAVEISKMDKTAARDIKFFNEEFKPAIPNTANPDVEGVRFTRFGEHSRYSLVYLIDSDHPYIQSMPDLLNILGSEDRKGLAGKFIDDARAIAISDNFNGAPWLKAVLFLHELRHAWYCENRKPGYNETDFWLEEADVWLYESKLLNHIKGDDWRCAIDRYIEASQVSGKGITFSYLPEVVDSLKPGEKEGKNLLHTVLMVMALYEISTKEKGRRAARIEIADFLKYLQMNG